MAAEPLLGVVVEAVQSQTFSLVCERTTGAWGVDEDLQRMAHKLEMIQDLLSDAQNKSTHDEFVQLWLRDLEDATIDSYFCLDEFAHHLLRREIENPLNLNKVRRFFSNSNPFAFHIKMASKIRNINFRFDGILKQAERIGLVRNIEMMNSPSVDIRKDRNTDPFVINTEIFGRNEDVEEIVSKLTSLEDEIDLSVIGIVGMAGQGKTTLAQLVNEKVELTSFFDKKIWVRVSDDFAVEKILNDIMQSLTKNVSKLTIKEAIVIKLQQELKGKRFLLVLDDVWNEDTELWSCMKKCLLEIGGSKGSKILVTTRSMQVVLMMKSSFIHKLGALSEEDSWKLFEKIAFVDDEAAKTAQELVNIGKTMVKRCWGLPLAIKTLAGLMYSMKNASEWTKIAKSNAWNSLDPQTKVMSVVKLSYDHLPSLSLKQCFAYCAIFEKDSIIRREKLIQQWMAHGLLNPSRGSKLPMEDVGKNYFEILLQRSLFQDVEFDKFGNIKSCKMHDVVHDFVLQASKDWCLIIEDGLQREDIKAVHLSFIAYNRSECPDALLKLPNRLRTLFLADEGNFAFYQLTKYKYLCVLVLNVVAFRLPSSIAKLKHLRYLDVWRPGIFRPYSITKLYNLQTLRLGIFTEDMQIHLGNLVKLRHLYIRHFLKQKIFLHGISRLVSLRTLPYFVLTRDKRCQIKDLEYLHNLEGNLKIYGLENVSNREEAMKADLTRKINIVNLELHWGNAIEEDGNYENVLEGLKPHSDLKGLTIDNFAGESLPSWMLWIDKLVSITLTNLSHCQQIPLLGQFPHLKVAHIEGMKSVKCIGNEFYDFKNSSSLRELYLKDMPNLEQWSDLSHEMIHEVVFPFLEILEIESAPKLTQLPNVLNTISSLKKLRLANLNNLSHFPEGLGGGLLSLEELIIWECCSLVSNLSIQSLPSLRKLIIGKFVKLGVSPNRLDECLKLEELEIYGCSSIRFEDLCCPTNLRKLKLHLYDEDVDYEEFPWPKECNFLPFLEIVNLKGNSKTKLFPEQIQHLPALRMLLVQEFNAIEALPEWLCNIPSLQYLEVISCRNLEYLPSREALQRLTTSCELRFYGCPNLKGRCMEGSGLEWDDNIVHLPTFVGCD